MSDKSSTQPTEANPAEITVEIRLGGRVIATSVTELRPGDDGVSVAIRMLTGLTDHVDEWMS
jgi:hypothetical protein